MISDRASSWSLVGLHPDHWSLIIFTLNYIPVLPNIKGLVPVSTPIVLGTLLSATPLPPKSVTCWLISIVLRTALPCVLLVNCYWKVITVFIFLFLVFVVGSIIFLAIVCAADKLTKEGIPPYRIKPVKPRSFSIYIFGQLATQF